MRIDPAGDSAGVLRLLRRPVVMAGMAAVGLFFMGQFTVFTYLRPFLESVVHADVGTLSLLLLLIGIAGFVGSSVIGFLLNARLGLVLVIIPLVMAAIAFLMVLAGGSLTMTAVLLAAWGFLATSAPVAWWTWLARTLPKDSEAGGGLMVAVIQLSITAGAALGGVLCDSHGVFWSFVAGAVLLLVAAGIALLSIAISDRSVIQV
jgi:predicted MFS family arabinose efflux permease